MADFPGQLLSSKRLTDAPMLVTQPYLQFKRIEPYPWGTLNLGAAPLVLIRNDGTMLALGTEGSPLLEYPADLGPVLASAISTSTGAAIRSDGTMARWPRVSSGLPLPETTWIDVKPSLTTLVGLTSDGTIHAWDSDEIFAVTGAQSGARSICVGLNFGAALDKSGTPAPFAWSGFAVPSLPQLGGLRLIKFPLSTATSQGISRAVAIRQDGTLIGLTAPFSRSVPGGYVDAHISLSLTNGGPRVAALRHDGIVDQFISSGASWSQNPTQWYGRYDSILLTNGNEQLGTWSFDTDRNGQPDAEQISAGSLEDCNGDWIPDSAQAGNTVLDADQNGLLDSCECAAINVAAGRRTALAYGIGEPFTGAFLSSARVPAGGSVVRRLTTRLYFDQATPTAPTIELTYAIWSDPDGDGNPRDATLLGSWRATSTHGWVVLDLEPTYIGPPGTSFFHGVVGRSTLQGVMPRWYFAPMSDLGPSAGLDSAGLRGRVWMATTLEVEPDITALVRTAAIPLGSQSIPGDSPTGLALFQALTWDERRPSDCDNSGTLDGQDLIESWQPWDRDLDNDGVIDSCERDCNANGVFDFIDIKNGAPDCDRDLVPDDCATPLLFDASVPVPGPSEVNSMTFDGVKPLAGGGLVLAVTPTGDFDLPTEFSLLRVGTGLLREIEDSDIPECAQPQSPTPLGIPLGEWNAAAADGSVSLHLQSTSLVNPTVCPTGSIRVQFDYPHWLEDCQLNGIPDRCESFSAADCDGNRLVDDCEIADGARDIDGDGTLDACQQDCDHNNIPDAYEFATGIAQDCNGNGVIDMCEGGDCDDDGTPDVCEVQGGATDCNGDLVPDSCQSSLDCNGNGIPESCEGAGDCDFDGLPDSCEILAGAIDCNLDGIPDSCQAFLDCDDNGTLDACEPGKDCDANGEPDLCEIQLGAPDVDNDNRLDICEYARCDFDLNNAVNANDLAFMLSVWGSNSAIADVSGDGIVGGADLAVLLTNWGLLYP
jgi:hypothetical protein